MTTTDLPALAGSWPDASLRPDDDAPPAEWARFYRDRCGWIVLPTAGPRDVMAYAISLHNEAVASYAADHGGDVPDDLSAELWDDAREIAGATRGRPIGYLYKAWTAKAVTAEDITDEMIALAWEPLERSTGPRAEADQRGIAILPNKSTRGLPVCLVDVDVGHDDSPAGDVDGPWGHGLPGPKASTPRGGLHTLMISTGKETASADLGPGIDVVAGGGTTIPVPAGSATPGRRWLRWDPPVAAPDELRKRGKRKKSPPRPDALTGATRLGPAREPGDDVEDDGRTAAIISAEVGDGERNWAAAAIVGILARPRACPDDVVHACLVVLAEVMAGRDASREESEAEQARWRHALTRGPRDGDFAAEVLSTWVSARDTSRRPWSEGKTRGVALSLWKTCDRREEGQAGAEDYGVGPVLASWPAHWAPVPVAATPPPVPDQSPTAAEPEPPVPYPPPPRATDHAAVREPRAPAIAVESPWRGGIDPAVYVSSLADGYPDDALERDLALEPIQIASVFPVVNFATGQPLVEGGESFAAPLSFGWGEALNLALGGLVPGDVRIIGAAGAGAGKTWLECWLAHGLALQTAARLLGARGYDDAPLVLPIWLTEMPKEGELYWRLAGAYLGFDVACLSWGLRAASAPGVIAAAKHHGMTPDEVVAQARTLARMHGTDERFPLAVARRHVIKQINLSSLPRRTRQQGVVVDHRSGPALIDHVADAVDRYREEFALLAGVPADQVKPLVMIDPLQRFAGEGESEKRAIDAVLSAVVQVLCREQGAIVIGTSDTTKGAARDGGIDTFLSRDASALAADIFAGTQAIMHHCDVLAVCSERPEPGSLRATQWVRLLKNRSGVPDVAFPLVWDKHLGRFRPGAPEPLRAPPPAPGQRPGGGDSRSRDGHGQAPPAMPRIVPGYVSRAPRERADLPD